MDRTENIFIEYTTSQITNSPINNIYITISYKKILNQFQQLFLL